MNTTLKATDLTVGQDVTTMHFYGFGARVELREYKVLSITKTRVTIGTESKHAEGGMFKIAYVVNKYGEVAQQVGKQSYHSDDFLPSDSARIAELRDHNAVIEIKSEARKAAQGFIEQSSVLQAKAAIEALQAYIKLAEV